MIACTDLLLDHIRDEVTRRRRELDSLACQSPAKEEENNGHATLETLDRLDLQPTGPIPERIRLRDLLRYHDRRFVEFAYRCILKRPVDVGGDWYVDRLRRGKSRINALIQIRYGHEGKAQKARIRGLWIHRAVFLLTRMPVFGYVFRGVGYVLRLLWCVAKLPLYQREQEAWKHYTMSLFAKVEDHVNDSQSQISGALSGQVDGKQLADFGETLRQEVRAIEAATENQVPRMEDMLRQLNSEARSAGSEVRGLLERVEDVCGRVDELESTRVDIDRLSQRLAEIEPARSDFEAVAQRIGELEPVRQHIAALARRFDQLGVTQADLDVLSQRVNQLESVRGEVAEVARRADQLELTKAELEHVTRRVDDLQSTKAKLGEFSQRLEELKPMKVDIDVLSRRLERVDAARVDHDEFYARLEDRFRGSEEEIRRRQEYYVSFVEAAGAGTTEAPVLDVGCGRGEWLGVLRDHGMVGRGIEINEVFLGRCRRKHLEVKRAEALQHLESATPASLGAITGFHIIEHLPADAQIRLVQLAFRALRPGGLLILETPNPEHLSVGALRFYVDPTHVRPIPPALLEFMATHAGFENVYIERLAPSGDGEAAQGWSRFQDFAVIGTRP